MLKVDSHAKSYATDIYISRIDVSTIAAAGTLSIFVDTMMLNHHC